MSTDSPLSALRERGSDEPPRIYIAGPMTGLPEFNYPAFHSACAKWREAGWDAVNPADAFDGDMQRTYREYVEADMVALRTCQAIALLPGWDGPNARGSVWEREVAASLLNIPVYDAERPIAPPAASPVSPTTAEPLGWLVLATSVLGDVSRHYFTRKYGADAAIDNFAFSIPSVSCELIPLIDARAVPGGGESSDLSAIGEALGLLASAVRSGEDFTPTCQEKFVAARSALARLRRVAEARHG